MKNKDKYFSFEAISIICVRRITGNLCYENNKFIGPISLNENLNNLIRDVSYHETQKQKEFWESNEYKNPIFFYPFLSQVQ